MGCFQVVRLTNATSRVAAPTIKNGDSPPSACRATTRWLDLRYTFEVLPWVEGVLGGALLVAAGGWLATRRVVNQPPLTTLRAG